MENQTELITELSESFLQDGQAIRAFQDYFAATYDSIKGRRFKEHPFLGEEQPFTDRIEFYKFIKAVSEMLIEQTENWKLDAPEEYQMSN